MKTIVRTNDLAHYPEEWVDEIIDKLPEDVANWCFSNAPTWRQKELGNRECYVALRKLWQEIPVYIVTSEMSGQTVHQLSGSFVIPPCNRYNGSRTVPQRKYDRNLMYSMLTDVSHYTDGSFPPDCIAATRDGHRVWLTFNKYSVYTREFPYLKAYERSGTRPRIFVWADSIMNDCPEAYNYVLAMTIICSKIEALMDFDLSGNCYKIERSYSMRLFMEEYFRLKSIGLAFGWSIYLMSLQFPDIASQPFVESFCNCDIAHRIGSHYALPEPHYLFEGTRVWMETKRHLCFGPIYLYSVFDDDQEYHPDVTSVAHYWTDAVSDNADFECRMSMLLTLDCDVNYGASKLRDEPACGFNKLSVIHIPSSVVELRDYMFEGSRSLEIYLHPAIRHIADEAFACCPAVVHKPDRQ